MYCIQNDFTPSSDSLLNIAKLKPCFVSNKTKAGLMLAQQTPPNRIRLHADFLADGIDAGDDENHREHFRPQTGKLLLVQFLHPVSP